MIGHFNFGYRAGCRISRGQQRNGLKRFPKPHIISQYSAQSLLQQGMHPVKSCQLVRPEGYTGKWRKFNLYRHIKAVNKLLNGRVGDSRQQFKMMFTQADLLVLFAGIKHDILEPRKPFVGENHDFSAR